MFCGAEWAGSGASVLYLVRGWGAGAVWERLVEEEREWLERDFGRDLERDLEGDCVWGLEWDLRCGRWVVGSCL